MELFKIFGTIALNNSGANAGIDETGGKANKLASTMGTAFQKVGGFAVEAGKTIAKGLAVGTVAAGKLIQMSVESFAEYEQLVGGVETLFKNSSGIVMEYAKNAYKTAGMSANEYMSTVTSFSASLLQSLGGNTEEAAKVADMAISDMSDNANKMGTDISAIQNAYQGFAKQNYTMLDNLKLGYGGTQTEMLRLLADAEALTGVKYDISSLSDVYTAIHVIQEEMGITGTTAKEASETISGSLASMKASWSNLLNGVAGAGDLDALTTSFVDAASVFVGNLTKLMPSLVKGITGLIKGIAPKLPGMLKNIFPGLLDGAVSLISGLAQMLPEFMLMIVEELPNIMAQLATAFEDVFPVLADAVSDSFSKLVDNIPQILQSVGRIISSLWGSGIWPMLQNLFKVAFGVELPDWEETKQLIASGWTDTIWPAIQNFFKTYFFIELPDWAGIVSAISSGWETGIWPLIQDYFKTNFNIELPKWETITTAISDAWNNVIQPAISGFFKMFFEVGLPDWNAIQNTISEAWNNTIWPVVQNLFKTVFGVDLPSWESITESISNGWNNQIWPAIQEFFKTTFGVELPDFSTIVKNINAWWTGKVWPAIQNLFKAVFKIGTEDNDGKTVGERLKVWWDNVLASCGEYFKAVFGIDLPSVSDIVDAIENWWEDVKASLGLSVSYGVTGGSSEFTSESGNVYGGSEGGFRTGLDFVPRDNFLARLHQGEAVLTADEARAWRNGQNGQQEVYQEETVITDNTFIIQKEQDIYDLAVELNSLKRESRRGRGQRK